MGAFSFDASINTTKYKRDAEQLQTIAQGAAAGITRHFGKIATAVVGIGAAFLSVRAAVQSFNAAIAMGGQLNDLSARTGETAGNLAILQRAFENAGAGADSVGPTINRLQRAIVEAGQGGKEQAEAFAKLGINLSEIKNLSPTEQLQAIAKALQNVGNDSDRTAIAMQLLGRSGGELIPLLRAMGNELDIARGQLGSTPAVMDRVAGAFDTLGDNFNAISQKAKELAAGLLEQAAPALVEITNRIANIDAAGLGAKLSEYAVRTGQWMSETLKLNEALKNIETAVNGITSGNLGSGFSLMFMTARDTAFNAINQIVAASMAALSTVGDSIRQLFSPGSVTMAFIEGAFNMLGAKIAASISGYLLPILENIPFMEAAAEAVRATKAEAEQAATDIANIMYYEADNLKSEWAGILAEAPKAFAKSYAANMKDPLIDMAERTKQTADQATRVEQQTRAAAFNAKSYADEMGRAREQMLAGGAISPFGSAAGIAKNGKEFKFPWQGSGPSGPMIGGASPIQDGKGFKSDKPKTALDRLRAAAETDPRALAALMRIEGDEARATKRASSMQEMGRFGSAARVQMRAQEAAQKAAAKALEAQTMKEMFNASNVGEAVRNFERDSRKAGMTFGEAMSRMGVDMKFGESREKAMQRFLADQSKTEAERKQQAERVSGKGEGAANRAAAPATESTLQKLVQEVIERLPQNALAA